MSIACSSCAKPKANLVCKGCEAALCKHCVEFVDDDDFAYLELSDEASRTGAYCASCFTLNITPALESYNEVLERAKEVNVFSTDKSQESRLIKRTDFKVKVDQCADEKDLILRLAFKAAEAGYNTIVDMDLVYTKVRDGSFKLSNWAGTATAANMDARVPRSNSNRRSPSR